MSFPDFFDKVARIAVHDPLAEFLGAADKGRIEYGYADAVKLAGHSCPTVAGAYLMTLKALASLYPGALPERGAIRVEFRDDIANGVTGVIANVAALITGATQTSGFKGIAGRFDRRNLLFFNTAIEGEIRFIRVDSGASVEIAYNPGMVAPAPAMTELMPKAMAGIASTGELAEFGSAWQDRVRRILLDHFDNAQMVILLNRKG